MDEFEPKINIEKIIEGNLYIEIKSMSIHDSDESVNDSFASNNSLSYKRE